MSDLQIGLLVIGAAIVVGVVLFNWIQERRFRRQADAALQAPAADVLMQPDAVPRDVHERIEPALYPPASHAVPGGAAEVPDDAGPDDAAAQAHEPAFAAADTAPVAAPAASSARPAPPPPYDELIEYRVRIVGDGIAAGVLAPAFSRARTLGKAVRWLGSPVDTADWEDMQPWRDARYQQVVVTMQLADRNGAVQEEQLAALCGLLKAVAEDNGFRIACDDTAEAIERAEAIDRFCVDVDVLIGLNVVARGEGAVDLSRIVRQAEASGMVLGDDGVFQLLDSRGEPLYALCNHDAEPFSDDRAEGRISQGVTLQFDVPRVPDGLRVFDGMVAFGRKLANDVGGILVDDNLRPLTDSGIEKIRGQLLQIYGRMEARGVPSGSRRSLRLFS